MTKKRPTTSVDQLLGWNAAKRMLIFFAVLFVGVVLLAAAIA